MYTVRISFGILDTKNAQKTAAKETRPLSSFKFTLLIRLAPFIPVSNQHLASRKRIYGVELFPLGRRPSASRFSLQEVHEMYGYKDIIPVSFCTCTKTIPDRASVHI